MKILVMKFRHIGDVLLMTPLIAQLKAKYPHAQITVLVKAGTEAMLTGNPDIHQVKTLTGDKNKYNKQVFSLIKLLRKQQFDLAINTTEGDRGIIISTLVGAKKRLGFLHKKDKFWRKWLLTDAVIWEDNIDHIVLQNLFLLEGLEHTGKHLASKKGTDNGADNKAETKKMARAMPVSVKLFYKEALKETVRAKLTDQGWNPATTLVHIHPVSRWFFKCWQDEKMADIIDFIQREQKAQVVLTCSPDKKETDRLSVIIQQCQTTPIDLGGQLSLKELAALTDLADRFVGVDSAPMHMAAAVNTPVIALFGPSKAKFWGPWPNGRCLQEKTPYEQHGLQQVSQHTVIQQDWPCVPCGKAGCNDSKVSKCLEQLPVDQIKAQLVRQLQTTQQESNC